MLNAYDYCDCLEIGDVTKSKAKQPNEFILDFW